MFNIENDEILIKYMNLVLEKNKVMNLTAITDYNQFLDKHFYDSLYPCEALDFENKKVLDIGSGAGFPGVPIAIKISTCKVDLLEPLMKRCKFLNEVKTELQLENVTVINKRAEQIDDIERETYDIVVSRAVSSLPVLLELCSAYCKVGGYIIAYKGSKYLQEIEESKEALRKLHLSIYKIQNVLLPKSKEERFNIILKKDKITDKIFPREFSQIKKRPL